jgi:hypothetical protein
MITSEQRSCGTAWRLCSSTALRTLHFHRFPAPLGRRLLEAVTAPLAVGGSIFTCAFVIMVLLFTVVVTSIVVLVLLKW